MRLIFVCPVFTVRDVMYFIESEVFVIVWYLSKPNLVIHQMH